MGAGPEHTVAPACGTARRLAFPDPGDLGCFICAFCRLGLHIAAAAPLRCRQRRRFERSPHFVTGLSVGAEQEKRRKGQPSIRADQFIAGAQTPARSWARHRAITSPRAAPVRGAQRGGDEGGNEGEEGNCGLCCLAQRSGWPFDGSDGVYVAPVSPRKHTEDRGIISARRVERKLPNSATFDLPGLPISISTSSHLLQEAIQDTALHVLQASSSVNSIHPIIPSSIHRQPPRSVPLAVQALVKMAITVPNEYGCVRINFPIQDEDGPVMQPGSSSR